MRGFYKSRPGVLVGALLGGSLFGTALPPSPQTKRTVHTLGAHTLVQYSSTKTATRADVLVHVNRICGYSLHFVKSM